MRLRTLLAATLTATATLAFAPDVGAQESFRIVMVGDSIGKLTFPSVVGPDLYFDAEPGRSPYDPGADDRAGTVAALTVLAEAVPWSGANWIVVQEGATGTLDGDYISNEEWTLFVNDVLRLAAGRCLIFVYPGYGHTVNGVPNEFGNDVAYARTLIARDIFAQHPHRCIRTVNWWAAANSNPEYLRPDGLHPSATGVAWLAGQINAILPNA
jgi:lysophospholipase L1-like esterase